MAEKGSSEGYIFFNKQRKSWNAQYRTYDINTGKLKLKTKSFKTEQEASQKIFRYYYVPKRKSFIY